MKVERSHRLNNISGQEGPRTKDIGQAKLDTRIQTKVEDLEVELSVIYEEAKSQLQSSVYDLLTLEKLKGESENIYEKVLKIVEDMIIEQAEAEDLLEKYVKVGLDQTTIDKIKDTISLEGKLSIESISDKIVNLAKEVSGGEKGKIDVLIEAITKGFQKVEESLGKLPLITIGTYHRIIEKLEDYISAQIIKNEPENIDNYIREIVEKVIVDQLKGSGILDNLDLSREDTEVNRYLELAKDYDKSFPKIGIYNGDNEILKKANIKEEVEVEEISEKILNLIKISAKEDKGRLETLIRLVDTRFKEAEKSFGLLPNISKKTHARIMDKLEKENNSYNYMGPLLLGGFLNPQKWMGKIGTGDIRVYLIIILIFLLLYFGIGSLIY